MTHTRLPLSALLLLLTFALPACTQKEAEPQKLVVYSGRNENLVKPIIEQFQQVSGIQVDVRYGGTPELATALQEEGEATQADVFWSQDAGALGALHAKGLFGALPDSLLQKTPEGFRNAAGTWVPTSGRARVLAYAPARVDTTSLPGSVFELTAPAYKGRIAWAPTNGSFQAFVTAMRRAVGDDSTRQWLAAMKANGTKSYKNNTEILEAVANEEADYGITNHYYLLRKKKEDPNYPVAQTHFQNGDPGDLVNVSGIGVLKQSQNQDAAYRFVSYMLSRDAQQYFSQETQEYPVISSAALQGGLHPVEQVASRQPNVDLDDLQDLEGTLQMLREQELL